MPITINRKKISKILFVAFSLFGLAYFASCKEKSDIDNLDVSKFSCNLEDNLYSGKYRVSWSLEGASNTTMYDVVLEGSDDSKITNRPSISYMDFDLKENTSYTMTIKLKSNQLLLQTLKFDVKNALSNENIEAKCSNDNVDISFKKQLENSKCYILVNENLYTQDEAKITLTTQDINYKSFSFSERLKTESDKEIDYQIVPYSTDLQIQIPSDPVITFRPTTGNTYALKCDKYNTFKSFDIDLIQDNESIIKTDNVLKSDLVDGKVQTSANNIKENDITLKMLAHGERTTSTLIADIEYTKTFTYVMPSTLDIVDGFLTINNSNKDVNKYLVTTKAYSSGVETSIEVEKDNKYQVPSNECYSISVLPVLSGNYFTKASTLSWFEYFKTPTISLLSKEDLMYSIEATSTYYSTVVVTLTHNNEVKNIDLAFNNNRATFSLFNLGVNYIYEAGEYVLEAYVAPSATKKPEMSDGTEYTMYSSTKASSKIYKTETPNLTINKIDDGNKIEFKTFGYDDYKITLPGIIDNDSFIYSSGVSSYVISNELIEDSLERDISITCTKKLLNDNSTVVLASDPLIIEDFKALTNPQSKLEIITKENEKYFRFEDEVAATDNYFMELFYEISANSETLITSYKLDNNYEWTVDSLFGKNQITAGSYRLAISKTSNLDNILNSFSTNYFFNKLYTPTLNKSKSTNSLIYWTTNDTIQGYEVTINGKETTTKINNYAIDSSKLQNGNTNLEVISYGNSLIIESDPLVIKLYKLSNIEVSVKDSIVTYSEKDNEVTINTTSYLYDDDDCNLTDTAIVGNHINLLDLTSNESFNYYEAKTYRLDLNFNGNSNNYDFIYGISKSVSFTKQPYPSINSNTKTFTENNSQPFVMAIDNDNYIFNQNNAPIPSGKHNIYFKILGDGITTIDSNVFVYNVGA